MTKFITDYLAGINQERLKGDLQAILRGDAGLRVQAERYYMRGGMTQSNNGRSSGGRGFQNSAGAGRGGGNGDHDGFSDFSDFSD